MAQQEGLYSSPAQPFQLVESALLDLWDKAKRAVDAITSLRESNAKLLEHIKTLEKTIEELQKHISVKDKEIEGLSKKGSLAKQSDISDGVFYLSPEEREALEKKITELLQRLHAHLQ